jgi:hypothetical protein
LGKEVFGGTRIFFEGTYFYQDNKSTIQFEKNSRRSCGPSSRHIDIRYFWIKDRLGLENIDVVYCPTEQMLADLFTKPLQGNLFRKLKAVVMGHEHVDTLKEIPSAAPQERVEESADLEFSECEADVQSTDGRRTDVSLSPELEKIVPAQPKRSYAKVVKGRVAAKP